MCVRYEVFLRTTESIWKVKSVLENIVNRPVKSYDENNETFFVTLLGITIYLEYTDASDNTLVFQYKDELIPLITYDLQLGISYDASAFMQNYAEDLQKSFSLNLLDQLCSRLNCEGAVVRNHETVIDKSTFMEKFVTPESTK